MSGCLNVVFMFKLKLIQFAANQLNGRSTVSKMLCGHRCIQFLCVLILAIVCLELNMITTGLCKAASRYCWSVACNQPGIKCIITLAASRIQSHLLGESRRALGCCYQPCPARWAGCCISGVVPCAQA